MVADARRRSVKTLFPPSLGALASAILLAASGCSAVDDVLPSEPGACGATRPPPRIGDWDAAAAEFEARVLELTNARRSEGGCCGSRGCFGPSRALVSNENLRAAARLHARDMAQNDYFSHESRDGRSMLDRVRNAGFGGCTVGENIAQGHRDPEAVMAGWMESEGHCANLLAPRYRTLGVGYYDGPDAKLRRLWVQNFGD